MAQQMKPVKPPAGPRSRRDRKATVEMTPDQVDKIEWTKVTSSNVEEVAWHENKLFVRFKGSGRVYRYDANREHFDTLLEADRAPKGSVGKTFKKTVRGIVPYAQVKIRDPDLG